MTLSDVKIRNLKLKPETYKVADFDGLFIAVIPTGSKLWCFKYRLVGQEKLLSIGMYPAISLAQARQARDAAREAVAVGDDPSEAKQEEKRGRRESQGHTFENVGATFLDKQRNEGKSLATSSKTECLLKLANKDFGRKPISEITSPMVLRCLRKVEAKGNYETAHCLRARIGSIFRYAVASGIVKSDPTYALRDALIRPTVKHRAAITAPKALGGLLVAIESFDGQASIALNLMAILALRPH